MQDSTYKTIASTIPREPVNPGIAPALNRLDYIDGLRACACLMVFLMHSWMQTGGPQLRIPAGGHRINVLRLLMYGSTGVSLFLVLSGFCLFLSLSRPGGLSHLKIGQFAARRAWRILPAYYVALLLGLLMPGIMKVLWSMPIDWATLPTTKSIVLHVLLLHGLWPAAFQDINGVFWSLSLEWQLYFLFPLLVWMFHHAGSKITILGALLLTILYRLAAYHIWGRQDTMVAWVATSNAIGRLPEFALGMLAAWQLRRGANFTKRPILKCAGLMGAGVAFLVAGARTTSFMPFYDLFWGTGYFFVLRAAIVVDGPLHRLLSVRPLTWLGEISYSVYLLHMLVLQAIWPALRSLPAIWQLISLIVIAGIITLVVSVVLFRFFELPYMRAREHSKAALKVEVEHSAGADTFAAPKVSL